MLGTVGFCIISPGKCTFYELAENNNIQCLFDSYHDKERLCDDKERLLCRITRDVYVSFSMSNADRLVLAISDEVDFFYNFDNKDERLEFDRFKNITRVNYSVDCVDCTNKICLHPREQHRITDAVNVAYQ